MINLRFFFNTSKQITDRYQVLGRNVHMDYVQEHLRTKREVTFGETQERANGIELEILTDTVYVKVGIFTVNFGKGKFFFSDTHPFVPKNLSYSFDSK